MPRLTLQTRFVLAELLNGGRLHGLHLCELTGLPPGTVYPLLARLEKAGWVESAWEDPAEHHNGKGRPRRRYYCLTGHGAQVATSTRSSYRARIGAAFGAAPG